ncbi:hypothetical protein [Magnetospirillum aberrantis]|uniref:Uncharacterized protein n=1 Tax=Magnetospirillum aberrantis SpK TaxID=908842 RepID=A0A7C9UYB1_9PROT|nr:hypothetical protein [Magnetospirillum aberrantis]NFV79613.1 hypothetical protein [Magnetospirillum aberrantis SpK]
MSEAMSEVLNWVALHCPASLRPELLPALSAAAQQSEGEDAAELWRTLAERLVASGHMELAREVLKRWQVLAPPDHPLHAVLNSGAQAESPPPPPKPRPTPPVVKREEPNSRIVRVIDTTYTFHRVDAQMDKVQGRKVVCGWETFLDDDDKTSRAVLNQFEDGSYAPWAVSGVFSDFAGAAAVEVVVRTMQRHFVFTTKKSDATRRTLTNIVLPATAVLAVLAGYLMGILH